MTGARDSFGPMIRAALLLLLLTVVGAIGYKVVGGPDATWLDAVYMTAITLTTVGYGEAIDLSDSPGGRVFTVLLLGAGVGTFLYFFSNVTAFFVEGTLDHLFWRRRMARKTRRQSDHFIVCGGGHTGEHVVQELVETRRPVVLVERDPNRIAELQSKLGDVAAVEGDATDDDTLHAAGVMRARGLITCLSSDKDNLLVTFSANSIRPSLRIVSRCVDEEFRTKLDRAGASAVVSPNHIGGLRLVSEMIRPTVVSFLDIMLRDKEARLRVEELEIEAGSSLVGRTVGELRAGGRPGVTLIALRDASGDWASNPAPELRLEAGAQLIVICDPEGRALLEREGGADALLDPAEEGGPT